MNKINKIITLSLATMIVGCGNIVINNTKLNAKEAEYGLFTSDDFLKVTGEKVHTVADEETDIYLRGINVGGLFVTENWMSPYDSTTMRKDHKHLSEMFVSRFGEEKAVELWDYYRECYWVDEDYKMCKKKGMNVLRLPFTYMSVDPEFNNVRAIEGQKYNFEELDKFIEGAGRHGLYVILDLHGAYGSHNGQDHSGEIIDNAADVDFYSNEEKMSKTLDLWDAISERYKDNPIVAAYDLLNEPGEKAGSTTTRHFNFMDRAYDIIRENNDDHIIMFESCWAAKNLPNPTKYNWTNCIYQLHHYSWTNDFAAHKKSVDSKVAEINGCGYNVPFYIGEFFCQKNPYSWEYSLRKFTENKYHYTPWTYKVALRTQYTCAGTSIFTTFKERFDPEVATYEEIKAVFNSLNTFHKDARPSTLENGIMIGTILADFLGGTF